MQLWLIPLLPLAGFALNGLFGRRLSKTVINGIAAGSVLLSFLWVLKTLSALGFDEVLVANGLSDMNRILRQRRPLRR